MSNKKILEQNSRMVQRRRRQRKHLRVSSPIPLPALSSPATHEYVVPRSIPMQVAAVGAMFFFFVAGGGVSLCCLVSRRRKVCARKSFFVCFVFFPFFPRSQPRRLSPFLFFLAPSRNNNNPRDNNSMATGPFYPDFSLEY